MSATTGTLRGVTAPLPRRALRSAGAVFAGLLAIVVLSTATDAVLHATGVYPPFPQRMADSLFVLAAAYRVVYGVGAGYVTARLAPRSPTAHALALGGVGVVLSTAGAVAMGAYGPAWYSLANVAIALPCAWAGARLHARRAR
ncbi:MAG TPA: hypothetical protein VHG91_16640 [Longimicrobium sp.]|nr:hypothetical protein [Longimicrobium sp.]